MKKFLLSLILLPSLVLADWWQNAIPQSTNTSSVSISISTPPISDVTNVWEITKDPSGWSGDTDNIGTMYFSTNTRVFSMSNATPMRAYYHGTNIISTTSLTFPAIGTNRGVWYLYLDGDSGTQVVSQTAWGLDDIQVASVNWAGGLTNQALFYEETHGFMPWSVHQRFHLDPKLSSAYVSGLTVVATSATFTCSSGIWMDEDIVHTISSQLTNCIVALRDSNTGFMEFRGPRTRWYLTNGVGGLMYDLNGTNTAVSSVGTANYVAYYCYITPCENADIMWVVGQQQGTLSTIQNENPPNISTLSPTAESILLYKVILRGNTAQFIEATDYRTASVKGAQATSQSHSTLTGRADANQHPLSAITEYANIATGGVVGGVTYPVTNNLMFLPTAVLTETDSKALARVSKVEDELALQSLASIAYHNATVNPYRWYRYTIGNAFEFDVTNNLANMRFISAQDYWTTRFNSQYEYVFQMDSIADDTVFLNSGSANTNGILPANASAMQTNGAFNTGYYFSSGAATVPFFVFGTNWTFSIWINGTWSGVAPYVGIYSSDATTYPGFGIYAEPNILRIAGSSSGSSWDLIDPTTVSFGIPDDTWTMVSIVHEANIFTIYSNSVSILVYTNDLAFTSTVVEADSFLGQFQGAAQLTGSLDEFLLTPQSLTPSQIQSIYLNGILTTATNSSQILSQSFPLSSSVTQGKLLVLLGSNYPVRTYINTNVIAEISANNGSSWTNVLLTYVGAFNSTIDMWEGTNTYFTSGTNLRWRVSGTNTTLRMYGAADWGVE